MLLYRPNHSTDRRDRHIKSYIVQCSLITISTPQLIVVALKFNRPIERRTRIDNACYETGINVLVSKGHTSVLFRV